MKTEKFQGISYGTISNNIREVIGNMIDLSRDTEKNVQTTFNGAIFSVTPETTPEEALSLWQKTMKENSEEWKNSPEEKKRRKNVKQKTTLRLMNL